MPTHLQDARPTLGPDRFLPKASPHNTVTMCPHPAYTHPVRTGSCVSQSPPGRTESDTWYSLINIQRTELNIKEGLAWENKDYKRYKQDITKYAYHRHVQQGSERQARSTKPTRPSPNAPPCHRQKLRNSCAKNVTQSKLILSCPCFKSLTRNSYMPVSKTKKCSFNQLNGFTITLNNCWYKIMLSSFNYLISINDGTL